MKRHRSHDNCLKPGIIRLGAGAKWPGKILNYPRPGADYPRPVLDWPQPIENHPRPSENFPRPVLNYLGVNENYLRPEVTRSRPIENYRGVIENFPGPEINGLYANLATHQRLLCALSNRVSLLRIGWGEGGRRRDEVFLGSGAGLGVRW